mmetsp:Transcript_49262/g.86058  ORF Transcript_49262/g.86058 Transcript_49262/m.86058 type:complete len:214 (-) Transcript_49262:1078-1719(-)
MALLTQSIINSSFNLPVLTPLSTAPRIARPSATTSSGFNDVHNSLGPSGAKAVIPALPSARRRAARTHGTRELPPTNTTSSIEKTKSPLLDRTGASVDSEMEVAGTGALNSEAAASLQPDANVVASVLTCTKPSVSVSSSTAGPTVELPLSTTFSRSCRCCCCCWCCCCNCQFCTIWYTVASTRSVIGLAASWNSSRVISMVISALLVLGPAG